jgi:DNA-binding transcriptional MerR regulator/methylmalonyl-CoA mutase cobalamin-binding subunit
MNVPIKVVARRTGLSAHVIRIWEKRYGVVEPLRTDTNRRLYTESEVTRLLLLRQLTDAGHSIGDIARLPDEKLTALLDKTTNVRSNGHGHETSAASEELPAALLKESIGSIRQLDRYALESILARGAVKLGNHGLLQKVIAPLTQQIGELWRDGTITAAQEHFASAVIRVFLGSAARPFPLAEGVPTLVVATPSGQIHELGAVMVMAAASDLGWRVTYLGASLPAAEIAGAAVQHRARAVALSIVYPDDDPHIPQELQNLRRYLPSEVRILVGGRAASSYRQTLREIGALEASNLAEFSQQLEQLRLPANRQ